MLILLNESQLGDGGSQRLCSSLTKRLIHRTSPGRPAVYLKNFESTKIYYLTQQFLASTNDLLLDSAGFRTERAE